MDTDGSQTAEDGRDVSGARVAVAAPAVFGAEISARVDAETIDLVAHSLRVIGVEKRPVLLVLREVFEACTTGVCVFTCTLNATLCVGFG